MCMIPVSLVGWEANTKSRKTKLRIFLRPKSNNPSHCIWSKKYTYYYKLT